MRAALVLLLLPLLQDSGTWEDLDKLLRDARAFAAEGSLGSCANYCREAATRIDRIKNNLAGDPARLAATCAESLRKIVEEIDGLEPERDSSALKRLGGAVCKSLDPVIDAMRTLRASLRKDPQPPPPAPPSSADALSWLDHVEKLRTNGDGLPQIHAGLAGFRSLLPSLKPADADVAEAAHWHLLSHLAKDRGFSRYLPPPPPAERLAKLAPALLAEMRRSIGMQRLERQDAAAALIHFDAALKGPLAETSRPSLLMAQASALSAVGKLDEADALLADLVTRHPKDPAPRFERALVLLTLGKMDDAKRLRDAFDGPRAKFLDAQAAADVGPENFKAACRQAYLWPNLPLVWRRLARIADDLKLDDAGSNRVRLEAALWDGRHEAALRLAATLSPESEARVLTRAGRFDDALKALARAKDPFAFTEADVLAAAGRLPELCRALHRLAPRGGGILAAIACLCTEPADLARIQPGRHQALYYRCAGSAAKCFEFGLLFQTVGPLEQALEAYQTAQLLGGAPPEILVCLGSLHLDMEKHDEAKSCWESARKTFPEGPAKSNPHVRYYFARLALRFGEPVLAERLLRDTELSKARALLGPALDAVLLSRSVFEPPAAELRKTYEGLRLDASFLRTLLHRFDRDEGRECPDCRNGRHAGDLRALHLLQRSDPAGWTEAAKLLGDSEVPGLDHAADTAWKGVARVLTGKRKEGIRLIEAAAASGDLRASRLVEEWKSPDDNALRSTARKIAALTLPDSPDRDLGKAAALAARLAGRYPVSKHARQAQLHVALVAGEADTARAAVRALGRIGADAEWIRKYIDVTAKDIPLHADTVAAILKELPDLLR